MKNVIKILTATFFSFAVVSSLSASLVISQYIETNSGSHPKGIEIWNPTVSSIDFTASALTINIGFNGAASTSTRATVSTGSLAAGDVMVVGSQILGDYLSATTGLESTAFVAASMTMNGDDAVTIALGGSVVDVFGTVGTDPGASWSGGGIETRNSSLSLLEGITTGTVAGWSDPSSRFELATADLPNAADDAGLAGFGVAPVPEPSLYALLSGIIGLTFVMLRRRQA